MFACQLALLESVIALSTASPVRMLVLPLQPREASDVVAAGEVTELLTNVLKEMHGVHYLAPDELDAQTRTVFNELVKRCGKSPDCRQKIGIRTGANTIVSGVVNDLGPGTLLELDLLDVGSGNSIGKISRTLSGSRLQRAAAVEAMVVRVLFPARMVGSLDIFINPEGAKVFVDGLMRIPESGPQVHLEKLSAGQHTVRIEKPGYSNFYALVQVQFSGSTRLVVNMRVSNSPDSTPANGMALQTIDDSHWYEHWWVWTIIGIIAAGATASTLILTR